VLLLDTSAIVAHWFAEPGHETVAEAIATREAWVAAPTWFELRIRLANEAGLDETLALYRGVLAGTVEIGADAAEAGVMLRGASGRRIPAVDALIAGAAKVRGFRLIHRDRHLAQIPAGLLDQTALPGTR